jgi:hypothetical protein
MAIVINGSGTVTGLSVGGLPDGTVDADTLASGAGGVSGVTSSADATAMTITSAEKIGIGETAPLGQLHIKEQDSGVSSISSNGDQLVLENSGHCGMHILSGTSSDGILYFGDSGGSGMGQLKYQHGSNQFVFETNQSGAFTITSDGRGLSPFTAKCWCVLNGTGTVAINDSHNVSSITDQGTGYYFVRYANNLSTIACSFVTLGLPGSYDDEHAFCEEQGNNDSIRVDIRRAGSGTQVDNDRVMVVVFDN